MNYYRRFPGDYLRDTAHLTMVQHGAYCLLLDYAYISENPLPSDRSRLFKITRAESDEEKAAVEVVLREFFKETHQGFIHKRVRKEIRRANSRAKTARDNGQLGGRPKTHLVSPGLDSANQEKSSLDSRLQTPDLNTKAKDIERAWPAELSLLPAMAEYATAKGVPDPQKEFDAWRDDCLAHGRRYTNWMAAWRSRVNRFQEFNRGGTGNGAESFAERNQRKARDTINEMRRNLDPVVREVERGLPEPSCK